MLPVLADSIRHLRYLSVFPIESFDPAYKTGRRDPRDVALQYFDGGEVPVSNWGWMPIFDAIKRGDEFVVEAKSSAQKVFLTFRSTNPTQGRYVITGLHPASLEEGTVLKAMPVREDDVDSRFEKICGCKVKLVIHTLPTKPPRLRKAWVVGFTHYKEAQEPASSDS